MDQFDIVQLKSTKRIVYLSGPKGYVTSPQGNWTIVGFIENEAILAKDSTILRVPIIDIRRVGIYSVDNALEKIKRAGRKNFNINMPKYLNELHGWSVEETTSLFKRYGLPIEAKNETHRDRIIEQALRVIEENGEDLWVN